MDELRQVAVFSRVVEVGSFAAAARQLGLSPSVVSHHVSQLEVAVGAPLLYRSTRKLSLTSEGARLVENAAEGLRLIEQGLDAAAGEARAPSGKLTVSLPALFLEPPFIDDVAAFAVAYPGLELTVSYSDLTQDLVRDGIDLAIRIGTMADSSLRRRRIMHLPRRLVCAPVYLKGRQPVRPEEMTGWDLVKLRMRPPAIDLIGPGEEAHSVRLTPRIEVDGIAALGPMVIGGLGLAAPPEFMVAKALADGRLVRPCPDWRLSDLPVYAVRPPNATPHGRAALFADYLADRHQERSGGRA